MMILLCFIVYYIQALTLDASINYPARFNLNNQPERITQMMQSTIFTNPITGFVFHWVSRVTLKIWGWKVVGEKPKTLNKCVFIAAPHTSNWDFPLTLLVAFKLRIPIYWVGKQEIFTPPFKSLMHWLGGISVNRSQSNNLVETLATKIKESEYAYLLIPPEGTRSKVAKWKTGFYHIANESNVPIVPCFLDFAKKQGGILETFMPSGDIEKDMPLIQAYYKNIKGKRDL